jgi:hypothetical protein
MAGKGGDRGAKAATALAGAAAAFVTRKAITFAWMKATGREPPDKAEDREVALGEALAWAVIVAAGVAVAKTLAVRLASRPSGRELPEAQE